MAMKLQYEIRRHTGKTRPAIGIFARGLRTYYFPKSWVGYIGDANVSFAQMLRLEMGLHRYITGADGGTVGRIKLQPRTKTRFSSWSSKNHVGTIERPNHFSKKLLGLHKLAYFLERVLLYLQK